ITAAQSLFGTLIGFVLVVGGPTALIAAQAGSVSLRAPGLTLLGMIASSIAGLALLTCWVRRGLPAAALGHTLPFTVGCVGIAITFTLWVTLNTEQNRRVHRQVQFETASVSRMAG